MAARQAQSANEPSRTPWLAWSKWGGLLVCLASLRLKDLAGHCVAGILDCSQFFASLFMALVVLSPPRNPFIPLDLDSLART
jgi:hypothetical protein